MLTFIRDQDPLQAVNKLVRIEIPALSYPSIEELRGKRRLWIANFGDMSQRGPVILRLARPVRADEESIDTATYFHRIKFYRDHGILLGYQQAMWLVKNQDELPDPARSALRELLGEATLDFPGLHFNRDTGGWGFPSLVQDEKRWDLHFSSPAFAFHRRVAVAVTPEQEAAWENVK